MLIIWSAGVGVTVRALYIAVNKDLFISPGGSDEIVAWQWLFSKVGPGVGLIVSSVAVDLIANRKKTTHIFALVLAAVFSLAFLSLIFMSISSVLDYKPDLNNPVRDVKAITLLIRNSIVIDWIGCFAVSLLGIYFMSRENNGESDAVAQKSIQSEIKEKIQKITQSTTESEKSELNT